MKPATSSLAETLSVFHVDSAPDLCPNRRTSPYAPHFEPCTGWALLQQVSCVLVAACQPLAAASMGEACQTPKMGAEICDAASAQADTCDAASAQAEMCEAASAQAETCDAALQGL